MEDISIRLLGTHATKFEATLGGGLLFIYKGLMLPTVDNLRNLFLTPTVENLGLIQTVVKRAFRARPFPQS